MQLQAGRSSGTHLELGQKGVADAGDQHHGHQKRDNGLVCHVGESLPGIAGGAKGKGMERWTGTAKMKGGGRMFEAKCRYPSDGRGEPSGM